MRANFNADRIAKVVVRLVAHFDVNVIAFLPALAAIHALTLLHVGMSRFDDEAHISDEAAFADKPVADFEELPLHHGTILRQAVVAAEFQLSGRFHLVSLLLQRNEARLCQAYHLASGAKVVLCLVLQSRSHACCTSLVITARAVYWVVLRDGRKR